MKQAFGILLIPLMGLFTILRNGRWNWDISRSFRSTQQLPPPARKTLNAFFWFGWTVSLLLGISMLLNVI